MAETVTKGLHGCSAEETYIAPTEPLLQERLEWFRDQKLALMMHFGPYSQMAIGVSSPLVDADTPSRRRIDWTEDHSLFRKQYFDLNKSFNPVRFQPGQWADFAQENGFKYLIFTTKHHDGFCMFDTQYTDYKITAPDCPFHTHQHANFAKALFDAFREKGMGIAAYFSKSDWHSPYYWAEGVEKPVASTRMATYYPPDHPELWEKFTEFAHNQILELIRDYGRIDILWLDGGHVKPQTGEDIQMGRVIAKAREMQPWLLAVNRTAADAFEDYITPEQAIPDRVISVPWESCVTIGTQWGYVYDDTYKSARTLVHMLIEVVSHGGNLALNIGPQPNGVLPAGAVASVQGLGQWLKVNGEAIYGTRAAEQETNGSILYTKKGETLFAILPLQEGQTPGKRIMIPAIKDVAHVSCLAYDGELSFEKQAGGVVVELPPELAESKAYALAFSLK